MFPVPGTSVLYFSLSVCACNGLLVPMTLLDGLETSKSFLKSRIFDRRDESNLGRSFK